LRELGWIEGRNIALEYRWAEGRDQRARELAAELVRRKPDVMFVNGTPTVLAEKQATATVPIVFAGVGDPVGSGIVANLARPGGNLTGISQQQTDTATKRLELLREVVPGLRRLAIMAHANWAPRRWDQCRPLTLSRAGAISAAAWIFSATTSTPSAPAVR
jgi:putative ABC transport system substrate-binding protein